jgi:hypothetical protein
VREGRFGQMVGIQGNTVVTVPLKDATGRRKAVDLKLYEIAAICARKNQLIAFNKVLKLASF